MPQSHGFCDTEHRYRSHDLGYCNSFRRTLSLWSCSHERHTQAHRQDTHIHTHTHTHTHTFTHSDRHELAHSSPPPPPPCLSWCLGRHWTCLFQEATRGNTSYSDLSYCWRGWSDTVSEYVFLHLKILLPGLWKVAPLVWQNWRHPSD